MKRAVWSIEVKFGEQAGLGVRWLYTAQIANQIYRRQVMNQMPNRRFTSGLSSGLSILAIFAFGYSLSGYAQTVRSAEHPTAAAQSAEGKSIEIPGTFKDLPAAKDAVTAKQTAATPNRRTTKSGIVAQLTVDESKGVTVHPIANHQRSARPEARFKPQAATIIAM